MGAVLHMQTSSPVYHREQSWAKTDDDARRMQEDLDALEEWETKWQMKFHHEKCQVIRINLNKRFERPSTYRLHGHTLEVVDSGKYLGVYLTNDLTWHKYLGSTVAKTLGFLRRKLSEYTTYVKSAAYTSIVRPSLEYSSAVWDPSSTEDNIKLEKVQRQAARFVHSNYFERTPLKNGLRSWLGTSTEEKTV